jgi:hypothetical protein
MKSWRMKLKKKTKNIQLIEINWMSELKKKQRDFFQYWNDNIFNSPEFHGLIYQTKCHDIFLGLQ